MEAEITGGRGAGKSGMTTIAVRDGVMAADTLGSIAGKRMRANKLFRCDNGHIIGIDGYWIDGKLFVDWYNAGANRDEPPKWRLLFLR